MRAYELKALNLMLDDSGNRAAHMAALKGREDIFKVSSAINCKCKFSCLKKALHNTMQYSASIYYSCIYIYVGHYFNHHT